MSAAGGRLKTEEGILSEVAEAVYRHAAASDDGRLGLMDGLAGICLFLYYYGAAFGANSFTELADNKLSVILDRADTLPGNYAEGLPGVVAAIAHLKKAGLCRDVEIDEAICSWLSEELIRQINEGEDDFFYGAAGLFNALSLASEIDDRWTEPLSQAVDALDKRIIERYDPFKKGQDDKTPVFCTGMPHGYASWIVLLSKLSRRGIASAYQPLMNLLRIFRKWLEISAPCDSFFPPTVDFGSPKMEKRSRLGWCNGDYPNLFAMLYAATVIGDDRLKEWLQPYILKTLSRKELLKNSVLDAGFCHGVSGIAEIVNRLYLTYGLAGKEALDYWPDRLCSYRHIGFPETAGYLKAHYGKSDMVIMSRNFGLLEGLSGIGLVLISLTYGKNSWDELFLLS